MENLSDFLRTNGLKATDSRVKILTVLVESDTALSHNDITHLLGDSEIDKVTLYRTLNVFTEKKIIHKVAGEDRNWRYAIYIEETNKGKADEDHAHFVCNSCDQIYCFPMKENQKLDVSSTSGFLVKASEVRLHGLCPSCQI